MDLQLGQALGQEINFIPLGRSAGGHGQRLAKPVGVAAWLPQQLLSEAAGGLDVGGVVEQVERLHRGVGPAGAHGADAPRRVVEEHRRLHGAPPKGVQAAPVQRLAAVPLVDDFAVAEIGPHARRLVRLDRRAAHAGPQLATDRERLVADRLRAHAMARPAGDKAVLRIALEQLRCHGRGLAVGRTGDDESVQLLHVPAGPDELGREPVEKLGVRGVFALHAEILGCLDEAGAEEMLPVTIHRDAGGERVARVG